MNTPPTIELEPKAGPKFHMWISRPLSATNPREHPNWLGVPDVFLQEKSYDFLVRKVEADCKAFGIEPSELGSVYITEPHGGIHKDEPAWMDMPMHNVPRLAAGPNMDWASEPELIADMVDQLSALGVRKVLFHIGCGRTLDFAELRREADDMLDYWEDARRHLINGSNFELVADALGSVMLTPGDYPRGTGRIYNPHCSAHWLRVWERDLLGGVEPSMYRNSLFANGHHGPLYVFEKESLIRRSDPDFARDADPALATTKELIDAGHTIVALDFHTRPERTLDDWNQGWDIGVNLLDYSRRNFGKARFIEEAEKANAAVEAGGVG